MSREITFVETMKGHVSGCEPVPLPEWDDDPVMLAREPGGESLSFALCDLVLRVRPEPGPDDGLPGELTGGTVLYGGRSYRVTRGQFVALASAAQGRRLRYRLQAESDTGDRIDVVGVKFVTGRPWRWWTDTTRMHVLLSTSDGDSRCASGEVRIGLGGFAKQLTTFRGRPGDIAAFLVRFAGRLMLPNRSRARSTHGSGAA